MTRHNLASHISWLLSIQVTPPTGVHTLTSTPSIAVEETASAGLAEEGAEHQNPRLSGNRRAAQAVNVGQRFIRPAAPPPPNPPKVDTGENTTRAAEESMGKLASASRSTRPALISQHQLATPVSTTASSSLTQGYATFLRTNNGRSKMPDLFSYINLKVRRHAIFQTVDRTPRTLAAECFPGHTTSTNS
jgi:bloom syndrome protein